jgi:hypothetical protein
MKNCIEVSVKVEVVRCGCLFRLMVVSPVELILNIRIDNKIECIPTNHSWKQIGIKVLMVHNVAIV